MSKLPGWLGRLGADLTEIGARLEARRAEGERRADEVAASGSSSTLSTAAAEQVPRPPAYAPSVAARPEPVAAIPWGMRVAAEAGWRLLVLAGTLWVLMRIISAVQLVVLAFVAALLVTAMLQPTVVRLRRVGLPRGLATAVTAVLGFVIMGLVGWFVVWQVMDNLDTLSDRVRDGIDELKQLAPRQPVPRHRVADQRHRQEPQRHHRHQHRGDHLRRASRASPSWSSSSPGILLAMFSTLFLLYDGKRIWQWVLKLVPAQARPGVAGAGPRAWRTLTAYVRGTVIVALIDAIFIGLGIYFLDVPMAVPLAVFIFLFAFIPLVGAVVSGALAVVVSLVTQGVFTGADGAGRGARRAADRGPHPAALHPRPRGTRPPAGRRPLGRGGRHGRGHRRRGRRGAAGRGDQHGGRLPAFVRPGRLPAPRARAARRHGGVGRPDAAARRPPARRGAGGAARAVGRREEPPSRRTARERT